MDATVLKIINERSLASVMSRTKWKRFADAVASLSPDVSVKFLDDEMPTGFSRLDWEWVRFGETSHIEWMEIDPIKRIYQGKLIANKEIDLSSDLAIIFKTSNTPFSREKEIFKIWGYITPNSSPNFESHTG